MAIAAGGRGMRLTERSLRNPAAVAAAAGLVVLFGLLAMLKLPIQLLPDTSQPQLSIETNWREAAPAEIEEALIEPIEEAMRGLPGLVEMRSESNRGRGRVRLTLEIGTDMTRVMLDVVSRLNTLPPLPPDADEPQVFGGNNWQTESAGSLLVRPLPGHSVADIAAEYQQLMEEAMHIQRGGDIKAYSAKVAEAEEVMKKIESIQKERAWGRSGEIWA